MRRLLLVHLLAVTPLAAQPDVLYGVSGDSGVETTLTETTAQLGAALASANHACTVDLLATIATQYATAAEPEQKRAVAMVGKAAKNKDLTTRHGAFAALAEMGAKGSSKFLRRWLRPPKKSPTPSHIEAIKAAGKIADASTLKTLEKVSNHRDLAVATTATEALGGFKNLKSKRRKTLAFDLVRRLEGLTSAGGGRGGRGAAGLGSRGGGAQAEPTNRRQQLARTTILALRELTGARYQTVVEWKDWRQTWKHKDPWK